MARDFYPFVEKNQEGKGAPAPSEAPCEVTHSARIAVYDDAAAAPRVVVIEPTDVRSFLEEITATVNRLSHEQGGTIPFMVIREIVENFIHALFQAPTITILDGGNTIRFSDQGPGIKEKALALEYGTSSATEEMKRYIRGVGSGLPYAQQYMADKGGSLEIEDNIAGGTVVTISTRRAEDARVVSKSEQVAEPVPEPAVPMPTPMPQAAPYQGYPGYQPYPTYPTANGYPAYQPFQQPQPMPVPTAQPQAPQPQPQAPAPFVPTVSLDERSQQVLSFLAEHPQVGPTDLVQAFGSSGATWSRVLSSLAAQGLVLKTSQKYQLTAIGRSFVS